MPVDAEVIGDALGEAIARLFTVPLSSCEKASFESRFYGGTSLDAYVTEISLASRQIHERVTEYASEMFDRSLSFLEAQIPQGCFEVHTGPDGPTYIYMLRFWTGLSGAPA